MASPSFSRLLSNRLLAHFTREYQQFLPWKGLNYSAGVETERQEMPCEPWHDTAHEKHKGLGEAYKGEGKRMNLSGWKSCGMWVQYSTNTWCLELLLSNLETDAISLKLHWNCSLGSALISIWFFLAIGDVMVESCFLLEYWKLHLNCSKCWASSNHMLFHLEIVWVRGKCEASVRKSCSQLPSHCQVTTTSSKPFQR